MPASNPVKKNIDRILSKTLRINEIFYSIQGETRNTGLPTTFIRLTGCPLRCHYCDTEYAFYHGSRATLKNILQQVSNYRTRYVTVTGGEPLAQNACIDLMELLCDEGYNVTLETSGAIDISNVDERVGKILDLKTPGSGESAKNRIANLKHMTARDQIKFVLCDEEDYIWAKALLHEMQLHERCEVLFSPSYGELEPRQLADWILRDQLPVRLQTQLHKTLWGDTPGK